MNMATSSTTTVDQFAFPRIASLAPWLSRIVMIAPMLIMIAIAVRCISNPTHAVAATGVTLSTPEALTDTRVIGGLALTIAFVIATSIASRQRLRTGHLTVIALMACVLAVRLFGFAHDGTTLAMGDQKVKLTGESVFLSLNALGFALQTYLTRKRAVRP
jgi:hypothetical protein